MATALTVETTPTALQGLGRMAPWRQGLLLVGLAASIAVGVSLAMWSRTPSYTLLYGGLGAKDASAVSQALQRAGIDFRVDEGTGAILVPGASLQQARLELAQKL